MAERVGIDFSGERVALPRVHSFPANLSYCVGERFESLRLQIVPQDVRFRTFLYPAVQIREELFSLQTALEKLASLEATPGSNLVPDGSDVGP
jgi:hypothetical protein